MTRHTITSLRIVGLIEGVSFLLLLGVAMPMKYMGGIPEAVKIAGWAHGILFMVLCLLLVAAGILADWKLRRQGMVFAAALIPFGPFLIDRRLKEYDDAYRQSLQA
ncbi:MAG: DUF3817 domain-containing protein [Verrucomicrobiota bacterium]